VSIVETGRKTLRCLQEAARREDMGPRTSEIGRVLSAGDGIAVLSGLPSARSQELLQFSSGGTGVAFNVDEHEIGCVLLGDDAAVSAGETVKCTGEVVRTPVGKNLIGRVIDPLGNPLDGGPPIIA